MWVSDEGQICIDINTSSNFQRAVGVTDSNVSVANKSRYGVKVKPANVLQEHVFGTSDQYVRIGRQAEYYHTSHKGGPVWETVHRRSTMDLYTGVVIEDIPTLDLPDSQCHLPIPGAP